MQHTSKDRSPWLRQLVGIGGHGGAAAGGYGKELHPLFANAIGLIDEPRAGFHSVLDDDNHASVEQALGMFHVGGARAFGGDDVLNGDFGTARFENAMAIGIFADVLEMAKEEKIGHFGGRDQTHQIEIEIGIASGGNVIIIVELRESAVEIILPH